MAEALILWGGIITPGAYLKWCYTDEQTGGIRELCVLVQGYDAAFNQQQGDCNIVSSFGHPSSRQMLRNRRRYGTGGIEVVCGLENMN